MTSIPYDPSLVLGQIVEVEKIQALMEIAEAQNPLDLAQEKLNNVLQTTYSLKMIYGEMETMKVPQSALNRFKDEMKKLEKDVVTAAIQYGVTARKVYQKVENLLNKQAQKTISASIESPMDYEKSELTKFPLAFDALTFDVQYFRNESQKESASSSAKSSTSKSKSHSVDKSYGFLGIWTGTTTTDTETNSSSHSTAFENSKHHNVEGTIVITAKATHKNAAIISPFVLDPLKAVKAWNYTHPDDIIKTDPQSIISAALDNYNEDISKKKTLDLLSGCTKASSFTGYIHLLKQEKESSSQTASSRVKEVKTTIEKQGWFSTTTEGYADSTATSSASKKVNSDSYIQNHANIVCNGVIPSIVLSDISSTVANMSPDPKKIMEQQAAIAGASASSAASPEGETSAGKKGAQYMALNSEFIKNSVSNLGAYQEKGNKVIDSNSVMAAFEDFIKKVEEGDCGVPTNFYIKKLTKNDIAKVYIKRFYPNGITQMTPEEMRKGAFGISSGDDES